MSNILFKTELENHCQQTSERKMSEEPVTGFAASTPLFQNRSDVMYAAKLVGRIDAIFLDRMSAKRRAEQGRC